MRKIIFLLLIYSAQSFGQAPVPETFKDRLYYGGNFGLGFGGGAGSSGFYSELSPFVGYRINDKLSVGPGLINQYKYEKFTLSPGKVKEFNSYNYGVRFFARYQLFSSIFLHSEYETLSYNYLSYNPYTKDIEQLRRSVDGLFVGGGYRSYMSSRSALDISVLFNLNQSRYSPYSNPVFRVGFVFF